MGGLISSSPETTSAALQASKPKPLELSLATQSIRCILRSCVAGMFCEGGAVRLVCPALGRKPEGWNTRAIGELQVCAVEFHPQDPDGSPNELPVKPRLPQARREFWTCTWKACVPWTIQARRV